MQEAVEDDLKQ